MALGTRRPADGPRATAQDTEDRALLAALRAGDGSAVAALYDRHAAALYALARCVLGDGPGSEDAVVDVVVEFCGPRAAGWSQDRSVRHELARATYQRCQAPGPSTPAARPRALALCLFGDYALPEAVGLTGAPGASIADLLRGAVADRRLPVSA